MYQNPNYTAEFKEQVIKEAKETGSISTVAKRYNLPISTLHAWLSYPNKRQKKEQTREVATLKQKLAQKELEVEVLKDLLKKTHQLWLCD